jgi:Tubulin domain
LCLADLKGSFGTLNPQELHEDSTENIAWDGNVETQKQEPFEKNEYLLSLDSTTDKTSYSRSLQRNVKVWSDFKAVYLHPKSYMEISTHTHNDVNNQFTTYTRGKSVYNELNMASEMMEDRIRKFMEEADSAQGFKVIADVNDAFSGFTSQVVQDLKDDYDKKSCFVFGIHAPVHCEEAPEARKIREVNKALFMHDMLVSGPVYVPLNVPTSSDFKSNGWSKYLNTTFDTPYLWSAYLAAGIETMTMPFRYYVLT